MNRFRKGLNVFTAEEELSGLSARTMPLKTPWFPWIGKRPFYGWVMVAIGAVDLFIMGIQSQGFSSYLVHLQKEFGWSRAVLAGPRSVTQVENAILGPLEGFLVDRIGPRFMCLIGSLLMGLGLILFGVTHSLWMYYVSNIVIAVGSGFQGLLVLSVAINHWFRRKRSMANALMTTGFAMAGVVGVPALVFLQSTAGWRTSAVVIGFLVWAVGIPLSALLRRSPEPYGLQPDGVVSASSASIGHSGPVAGDEFDFTLGQALRTRSFWLLAFGMAIGSFGMGAVGVHLFLHLENGVGLSAASAAFVWSVASMTNVPARLLGGFFGDRLPKHLIMGAATAVMSLSQIILGLATTMPMTLVYAVVYGIGWGARGPVMNAMQGEYFGRKSQGIIRGLLSVVSLPLTVAAPVIVGYMADLRGNYRMPFIIMSLAGLVGAGLIFFATAPMRPPAHKNSDAR